jgi:hypothetical protein
VQESPIPEKPYTATSFSGVLQSRTSANRSLFKIDQFINSVNFAELLGSKSPAHLPWARLRNAVLVYLN